MHNLHQLTGIRGLAAFIVVFYHIESYLRPHVNDLTFGFIQHGYLAVDFFFILSGFVIAFNYFEKLSQPTQLKVYQFYIKRIARIYPLHLFVLLAYLSIPVVYFLVGKDLGETSKFNVESFFLSLFLMQSWGWEAFLTWNIPSWSISTEMMAYLVFPIMVICIHGFTRRLGVIGAVILLLAAAILIAYIFVGTGSIGSNIQTLGVLRCVLQFFCGVCIWYITKYTDSIPYAKFMYYGSVVFFFVLVNTNIPDYYYVPLIMSMIILGSVSCKSKINDFFASDILLWLGNISYSIYLTHYFIRDWFKILFLETNEAGLIWIASYVITVLVISHFLYKYFEVLAKNKVLKALYVHTPVKATTAINEKAND